MKSRRRRATMIPRRTEHWQRPMSASREEKNVEALLEPFRREVLLDLRERDLLSRIVALGGLRRRAPPPLRPRPRPLRHPRRAGRVLDECHAVTDRATGRCRGYGFFTSLIRPPRGRRRLQAGRRPPPRLPARLSRPLCPLPRAQALRRQGTPKRLALARRAEEILPRVRRDRGGAPRRRPHHIFLYKSPEGLTKALEEPRKVFDGCDLHCRHGHRQTEKKKRATAARAVACNRRNVTGAVDLPISLPKGITSTSATQPLLGSKWPVSNGVSSDEFCQNIRAGILGASPLAMVGPSSLGRNMSHSHCRAMQSQSTGMPVVFHGHFNSDMLGWSGINETKALYRVTLDDRGRGAEDWRLMKPLQNSGLTLLSAAGMRRYNL